MGCGTRTLKIKKSDWLSSTAEVWEGIGLLSCDICILVTAVSSFSLFSGRFVYGIVPVQVEFEATRCKFFCF